jgi:hypothetical protein
MNKRRITIATVSVVGMLVALAVSAALYRETVMSEEA